VGDEAEIRILFLAASPAGAAALALDEEVRAITGKLRSSDHGRQFELIQAPAARREDLLELLNRHRPHIVHFSGHGGAEGLYFKGADGGTALAPAAAIEAVFRAC
jgi:hypothetical protein